MEHLQQLKGETFANLPRSIGLLSESCENNSQHQEIAKGIIKRRDITVVGINRHELQSYVQ